jgi:hypothetical protein
MDDLAAALVASILIVTRMVNGDIGVQMGFNMILRQQVWKAGYGARDARVGAIRADLGRVRFPSLLGVVGVLSLLILGGCMGWFEGTEVQLGYVLAKGDSEHIAKWTMKQTDGRKLVDGISSLIYRVVQARDDKEKGERAIEWCVIAVNHIADWPPDRVFPAESGERFTTRELVRFAFFMAASDAYFNPPVEELLHRLRPDANHAQWLGDWEESVAELEKSRQADRDLAATRGSSTKGRLDETVLVLKGIATEAPKGYGLLKPDDGGPDVLFDPGWPPYIVGKHIRITGRWSVPDSPSTRGSGHPATATNDAPVQMLAPGSRVMHADTIEVVP